MAAFLHDYWWVLLGATAGVAFAILNYRHRRQLQGGTVPAVSVGAIRAYSVAELQPFFGVYRPSWRELLAYTVLAAWFGLMACVITYTNEASPALTALAGTAGTLIAAAAAWFDARSPRVLGPETISFISPVGIFSWSVPLREVLQCDLVPGQPYNRLRVITTRRVRSLPLPLHLWEALRNGSPN